LSFPDFRQPKNVHKTTKLEILFASGKIEGDTRPPSAALDTRKPGYVALKKATE
jgi:hypothetical protein